ncbi:MAG: hypothetical protein RMI94_02115 [Bryobacterales bacterium]|nr:hypothetical protein [Bryobacteraceae bacterium]MDW8129313.1 hypothetical protein [Bryobacterales bacterium]
MPALVQGQPEYAGPSILSRGRMPRPGSGDEQLRLRPYATIAGVYDTGLTGVFTDEAGRLPADDGYGVMASFGVLGYHSWRRTILGLSYDAQARHYTRRSYYDGLDQSLALTVSHRATRRLLLEFNESVASRRGGFLGLARPSLYSRQFEDLSADVLFDTRIHVLASSARMVYQKSPRLSFGAGGVGVAFEPRSRALARARGVLATGDVAYRLSRFQTIGAAYSFTHYWFPGAFGEAYVHGAAAQWARELSRSWALTLAAGGYRVEATRLRQVRIDPVIAAIIGQRTGIEVFHRIVYVPGFEAELTRRFRRGSFSASYRRGVSAGNGLYLTSAREAAGIAISYTGTRRLHFSANAGYSRLSSLAQTIGRYRSYQAGAGMTYRIAGPLSLFARVDGRKYHLRVTGFGRIHYRATVGLSFSPGDLPLALW